MNSTVCLIVALLSLLGGCGGHNSAPVRETVMQYNALLADGYRNLNMNPLAAIATRQQATRVYHHMAALGEARTKMDAHLLDISFKGIEFTGADRAEARTVEHWSYTYINIDSGKKTADNTAGYTLLYSLVREKETWLVAGITIEEVVKQGKNEPPLFFKRPRNAGDDRKTSERTGRQ